MLMIFCNLLPCEVGKTVDDGVTVWNILKNATAVPSWVQFWRRISLPGNWCRQWWDITMINKKHFYCYLVAHPTMSSHRHHRDIYSLAMCCHHRDILGVFCLFLGRTSKKIHPVYSLAKCCHHRDRLQDRCVGGSAQDGRPALDLLAVHRHRSLALRHGCRSISSYCHSHQPETVS